MENPKSLNNLKTSKNRSDMEQDNKKEWSSKHDELVKKTISTSGKPMGFKSPANVIKHLESLGSRS
ncbi:hypothetical protein [Nitrosopumilus sp.]|uniref:hypothetical protein n=1 Tax=Nitrosopumilus sp. TaxID=2024843 RepID=UPI002630DC91|nr:hypothetical protein [Nitrosopumilus sp.]